MADWGCPLIELPKNLVADWGCPLTELPCASPGSRLGMSSHRAAQKLGGRLGMSSQSCPKTWWQIGDVLS